MTDLRLTIPNKVVLGWKFINTSLLILTAVGVYWLKNEFVSVDAFDQTKAAMEVRFSKVERDVNDLRGGLAEMAHFYVLLSERQRQYDTSVKQYSDALRKLEMEMTRYETRNKNQ